ncbi:MAG: M18 family aminopeptidase [Lachnospiraceae bacterium]|nr:M18 family aminopeptidase [Lachnospiraceae bacterium]
MKKKTAVNMLKFIDKSPTPFHVIENIKETLEKDSFSEYSEKDSWKLWNGMKGYVTRGDSSIVAFRIPNCNKIKGFHIYSAHSDSPAFKLKEKSELNNEFGLVRVNTEKYGGMILSSWLDRPLSVAGRVIYEKNGELTGKLVNIDRDLLVIPNVAVHMNTSINSGYEYKAQTDMLPVFKSSDDKETMESAVAAAAGLKKEEILGSDLFVYARQKGTFLGPKDEFVLSPRLDDQACVYAGLSAFAGLDTGNESFSDGEYINVFAVFDNEEVGSGTARGADSTFLEDVLFRISEALSLSRTDYLRMLADSFAVSADNAHAVHPAMPGKADIVNRPIINGGVVVKFNANQHYTTDGFSSAKIRSIAKKAGVRLQNFVNNSDVRGGSTLGNISTSHVSINTVDIGLAQLAMHSSVETMGAYDIEDMIKLVEGFYGD